MRLYRTHYLELLAPLTTRLPGAEEAIAAVRAAGARAVVITAKPDPGRAAEPEQRRAGSR